MTVPASGRFTYWTNPSTRPFVKKADKTESWILTCEDDGKVFETHEIVIDRGQVIKKNLPCGGKLPKAKGKSKKALKRCLAKSKKVKGKSKRRKAARTCRKRLG